MDRIEADRRNRWEETLSSPAPGNHLLIVEIAEDGVKRPPVHLDKTDERIEWAWGKYLRQVDRLSRVDDDRIPYLDCMSGTELFAAAFGCEVEYPKNDMPFAKPLVFSPREAAKLSVPSLDRPGIEQVFRIADALRDRAGTDAVLRIADIQSPMDIVGIIWDKNDFFIQVIEEPDAVIELAEKTRTLLTAFLDEWFSRYGRAFVAHYPDYYMPYGITLSEDEIGSVGPDVYETLFLPELNYLSARYGAIGIHCCADAEHQWEGLSRVERLRVLNLNQPDDVLARAFPFFADTAVQLPVQAPFSWPADHAAGSIAEAWAQAFAAAGDAALIYSVPAATTDDAERLAAGFREVREARAAVGR